MKLTKVIAALAALALGGFTNTVQGPQQPLDILRDNLWMVDTSIASGVRTMQFGYINPIYDFWMTSVCTTLVGPTVSGIEQKVVVHILNIPPGEVPASMWEATNGTHCTTYGGGKVFGPGNQFAMEVIFGPPPVYHVTTVMGVLVPTNPNYWH